MGVAQTGEPGGPYPVLSCYVRSQLDLLCLGYAPPPFAVSPVFAVLALRTPS